jgi:lipopolysaccharide heptosyltransferase II
VRLDSLGDVLMTTPALRALKQSLPGVHLTLWTSRAGARAAKLVSEVDDVLVFDAPWMKVVAAEAGAAACGEMIGRLVAGRFDGAVIFTVFSQNPLPAAVYCHLAGIPRRLAYCRENPYGLLTGWEREPDNRESLRHEVRRQLDLVRTIGAVTSDERLSVRVAEEDRRTVSAILAEAKLAERPHWAVVHPGASAPSRRYSAAAFSEVIRRLQTRHEWRVILTGSDEERPLIDEIRNAAGISALSLAGRLSIGQLAALIERAPLLISNNTGPVHIAAGLGTPIVDLYAQTNMQHTPWQVDHRILSYDVPCKMCLKSICPEQHHDCLARVDPQTVVAAALELMAERESSPAAYPLSNAARLSA